MYLFVLSCDFGISQATWPGAEASLEVQCPVACDIEGCRFWGVRRLDMDRGP